MDINRLNWPDWLVEKFDHYASLDFSNTWKTTIITWTDLERVMKFCSPVHHFLVLFTVLLLTSGLGSLLGCHLPTARNKLLFGTKIAALSPQVVNLRSQISKLLLTRFGDGGTQLILLGASVRAAISKLVDLDLKPCFINQDRTGFFLYCRS